MKQPRVSFQSLAEAVLKVMNTLFGKLTLEVCYRCLRTGSRRNGSFMPSGKMAVEQQSPRERIKVKHFFISRKQRHSAAMEGSPWREASSLIIASRISLHDVVAKGKNLSGLMESTKWNYHTKQNITDYRILMVKRSGLSSFMANAYVFPGGMVEVADFSPLWWSVFEKAGISRKDLRDFCSVFTGKRPPMIQNPLTIKSKNDSSTNKDHLPADIALRITSMRETFEETGVLLLTNPALETSQEAITHTLVSQNIDIPSWQAKVHNDPFAFMDLCLQSHMCPDIWSLREWSDWLTPQSVGHRRYDTIFYICCLPRQPDVLLDKSEVTVLKWSNPDEILDDNSTGTLFLAPPQVYELSRISPIHSYHALKEFIKKREPLGCERLLPLIITAEDGAASFLPGDDLYPKEEEVEAFQRPKEYSCSLDELRSQSTNLNRLEIRGPQCTIHCNVTPACGHLQPIVHKSSQPQLQSFL